MKTLNAVKMNRNNGMMARVMDGSIKLDNLMQVKDINMINCLHPIRIMQKIYSAESLVGAVTVVVGNICNIDVTKEENFKEFKESLVQLKDKTHHEEYGDSIWVDGVNVLEYKFANGQYYRFFVVTNAEMKAIEEKIAKMSKRGMTVKDAQKLQSDLAPILRAWQESSIDCTKDKNKKFNYDFRQFFKKIDVVSTYCKKHASRIAINTKEVFKDHNKNFKITLPSDTDEEVYSDLVGLVTEEIRRSAEEFYNGDLKDIYCMATMEAYEPFVGYAKANDELALFIKEIYQLCYNSLVKVNGKSQDKITPEQYATMRNAIYSKALDLGMEFADVVKVAIDTAMCTVKETKEYGIVVGNSDINAFREYPVKNIFPKEYQVALSNKPYLETIATIEDILDLRKDLMDNDEIEFVNGTSTDNKVVLINDFTGKAMVRGKELVAEANVYEFEEVTAMLIYKTFDEMATGKNMKYDKEGKYLVQLRENYEYQGIRVTGKQCNGLRNASHLIGVFRGTRAFVKDEMITIETILDYVPRNGSQRYFLVICK